MHCRGNYPLTGITPGTSHMWVVDKEDSMYDRATIDALKTSLRGELLQPDDAGYEVARRVSMRCHIKCMRFLGMVWMPTINNFPPAPLRL